jgi:hypothetical protein
MQVYPRPNEPTLSVEREEVDGHCPECGRGPLQGYMVLSEGGWWNVVKCQSCLHSVSRERAPRLGRIELLAETIK